ncbi:gliding motility-associated C-terminal domain-containing protein [Myroides sp. LJL116]
MKKKIYQLCFVSLVPLGALGQTINQGNFSVDPGTQVSTYFDFINESSANLYNDGEFHFYGHFQNDGLFTYKTNSTTGYVVFEGKMPAIQNIKGNAPSEFYNVLFDKNTKDHAFALSNDITTAGQVNLSDGVVFVDQQNGGAFVFLKGSTVINAKDSSYVEGEVSKEGDESFIYPIGKSGYYRFAGISAPSTVAESYSGEYFLENSDINHPHSSKTGVIDTIDNQEYWIIDKDTKDKNAVLLSLSWDKRTTPNYLLEDVEKLCIVRWDDKQKLWVNEGGIVDSSSNTVTTPLEVDGFGVFTLGTIKEQLLNPGDVVIYNAVTPNGDGINDYFIIDNIENYPNNQVTIINRWGHKVYETSNYNSNGNVFNGYAQGNGVINRSEKLPSGTYYYIVEYVFDGNGQSQKIKKTGYLHLENN